MWDDETPTFSDSVKQRATSAFAGLRRRLPSAPSFEPSVAVSFNLLPDVTQCPKNGRVGEQRLLLVEYWRKTQQDKVKYQALNVNGRPVADTEALESAPTEPERTEPTPVEEPVEAKTPSATSGQSWVPASVLFAPPEDDDGPTESAAPADPVPVVPDSIPLPPSTADAPAPLVTPAEEADAPGLVADDVGEQETAEPVTTPLVDVEMPVLVAEDVVEREAPEPAAIGTPEESEPVATPVVDVEMPALVAEDIVEQETAEPAAIEAPEEIEPLAAPVVVEMPALVAEGAVEHEAAEPAQAETPEPEPIATPVVEVEMPALVAEDVVEQEAAEPDAVETPEPEPVATPVIEVEMPALVAEDVVEQEAAEPDAVETPEPEPVTPPVIEVEMPALVADEAIVQETAEPAAVETPEEPEPVITPVVEVEMPALVAEEVVAQETAEPAAVGAAEPVASPGVEVEMPTAIADAAEAGEPGWDPDLFVADIVSARADVATPELQPEALVPEPGVEEDVPALAAGADAEPPASPLMTADADEAVEMPDVTAQAVDLPDPNAFSDLEPVESETAADEFRVEMPDLTAHGIDLPAPVELGDLDAGQSSEVAGEATDEMPAVEMPALVADSADRPELDAADDLEADASEDMTVDEDSIEMPALIAEGGERPDLITERAGDTLPAADDEQPPDLTAELSSPADERQEWHAATVPDALTTAEDVDEIAADQFEPVLPYDEVSSADEFSAIYAADATDAEDVPIDDDDEPASTPDFSEVMPAAEAFTTPLSADVVVEDDDQPAEPDLPDLSPTDGAFEGVSAASVLGVEEWAADESSSGRWETAAARLDEPPAEVASPAPRSTRDKSADVIPMRVAKRSAPSSIPALEDFMRRAQARRRQVAAESVA